jgi:tRNA A-37 threonylcarbamoyl transferase component Bud32
VGSGSIRICRGQSWGERLTQTLKASELDEISWMEQHTRLIKSDAYSRVGLFQFGGRLCYLKFYRAKSIGQKMLFRLGYARGVHSFDAALKLQQVEVRVPAPLTCIESPRGMMLLTEGVIEAKDLKALWHGAMEQSRQEQLLHSAGNTLSRLHLAGYCHGDAKWSNWLWSGDDFYLVDLEGVKQVPVGSNRQLRDLARFVVNAEDLAVSQASFDCFMESYLTRDPRSKDNTIRAIMPALRELRKRHEAKYGMRGHRLIGEIQDEQFN